MQPSPEATPQFHDEKATSNGIDSIATKEKEVLPAEGSNELTTIQHHVVGVTTGENDETTAHTETADKLPTPGADEEVISEKKVSSEGQEQLSTSLNKLSGEKRAFHQELLFGLFLQYSENKLGCLAERCDSVRLQEALGQARQKIVDRKDSASSRNRAGTLNGHRTVHQIYNSRKRRRNDKGEIHEQQKQNNPESELQSPLALVPTSLSSAILALKTSRGANGDSQTRNIAPIDNESMGNVKRKDHASLTMKALENKIMSKFKTSRIGKMALKTTNPNYTRCFESSEKEMGKDGSIPPSVLISEEETDPKFEFFPLKYNECSLASFAQWALHDESSKAATSQFTTETSNDRESFCSLFPAFPILFHCCQICRKWGHYELECSQIMNANDLSLSDINMLKAKNYLNGTGLVQKNGTSRNGQKKRRLLTASALCAICRIGSGHVKSLIIPCISCGLMVHKGCIEDTSTINESENYWYCLDCSSKGLDPQESKDDGRVVDLEGCEGFVIESRRRSSFDRKETVIDRPNIDRFEKNLSEKTWQRAICIGNTKLITSSTKRERAPNQSNARNTLKREKGCKNIELSAGTLCWAKRGHAEIGSPGQNEWWPAQVITVSKEESKSSHYGTFTPYVVKFFGVCRARATAVLPFFQHFRKITKKVRSGHSRLNYEQFHKNLGEVIALMGFNSIAEVEARADELCLSEMKEKHSSKSRPLNRIGSRFPCNADDEDATVHKQDKFVIHARASAAKKNSKERRVMQAARMFSSEKLPGSLVAWMQTSDSPGTNVGTVLVVDVERKVALVQEIQDWKKKLVSPQEKRIVVHNCQTTASVWKPMEELHMILNGPSTNSKQGVLEHIMAMTCSGDQKRKSS